MPSEGFPALEKNAVICSQKEMLPIQSGVTAAADSNGHFLAHLILNLNLLGPVCGSLLQTIMAV
jgi:hypothetical protein